MDCMQVQDRINDYLDSLLNESDSVAIENHIRHCAQCESYLLSEQQLRLSLRNMPIVLQSEDHYRYLIRQAKRAAQPSHVSHLKSRWLMAGVGSTALACLAIVLFFSKPYWQGYLIGSEPRVVLSVNDVKRIQLVFNIDDDLPNVTMSVELPPDCQLQGYPDTKTLTWQVSLSKGQNVLTLPIIKHTTGTSMLLAKLHMGDKQKLFRVKLESNMNQS